MRLSTLGVEQADRPARPNEKLKQVAVLALVFAFAAGVTPDLQLAIAVVPFEGGAPIKKFNLSSMFVRWSPDGRGLVYINNRGGVSNLWMQPLDEGKPVQLTNFQTDQIFYFDWSPNGKQLSLARGTATSDVVLFSDLK